MTALTQARATPRRDGELFSFLAAAAVTFHSGGIVMMNASGHVTPGATAAGCFGVGIVGGRTPRTITSGSVAGVDKVDIESGTFRFVNSASGDLITVADIGKTCWIVDDQTVAKTNGGATRSPAGTVVDVDDQGVWVRLGWHQVVSAVGALLAANNLSDVTAATARGNLGVFLSHQGDPVIAAPGAEAGNTITVGVQLTTIAGADLAARGAIQGYLAADANGDAVTGLTIASLANGTDGEVIPTNAALTHFLAVSESDGDIDIVVGCAGAGTCYLILVTPGGKLIASQAITFA